MNLRHVQWAAMWYDRPDQVFQRIADVPQSSARHTPEEIARIGDEIYSRTLRSQLEPSRIGEVVAIDVQSGDYAVAESVLEAGRRLRGRRPNAEVWFIRIGDQALHRIGMGGSA